MALRGTPLTETSAFTATVFPPATGTNVQSTDVEAGEQALANRTTFLHDCLKGTAQLPGVDPTATEDPGLQRFHALGLARAWANISTDGLGAVTKNDGYNVGGPTLTATRIKVPVIRAFASANYAAIPEVDATSARRTINVASRTTTEIQLVVFDDAGAVVDPTATALTISVTCHGRQL